jgi:hypothetical protein
MTGILGFTKLGRHGNLGNQLWEIASVMGIAHHNKTTCTFPEWKYGQYFNLPLPCSSVKFSSLYTEKQYHYAPINITTEGNTDLLGWFQSEKYFESIKEKVRNQFEFDLKFLTATRKKLFYKLTGHTVCAISVRRGDYVGNPNYAQLGMNYYIGAIKYMPKDCVYVVFSDDIAWCKKHFPSTFIFCEHHTAIEQLAMMSQCDHFIIANSSFSWWGAWLGEKESKSIIVAPHVWNAGPLLKKSDDKDVVPERWIKYNPIAASEKIDLKDVTFTIPVRIDHADRLENLYTCIDYLNKHFDTHIMVYECDSIQHIPAPSGIKYTFKRNQIFHRTKLLNEMAKKAKTDIIFNWDCDVFISPAQILETVDLLRNNKADGCYPYDGRFLRVHRSFLKDFKQVLNVEQFRGMKFKKSDFEKESFGGAVAWLREKFLEGGGENENFIDYGPEDWERYYRFNKLGYRLTRVKGPLFHIDHNIWSQRHENRKANDKEFVRIKSLSKQQLQQEVKKWNI